MKSTKFTFFDFSVGPLQKPFETHLVSDNSTFTKVDMGELGGVRDTLAVFKDNSLISYLHNDNKVIDIMAVRTVNPKSKCHCYNILIIYSILLIKYSQHFWILSLMQWLDTLLGEFYGSFW